MLVWISEVPASAEDIAILHQYESTARKLLNAGYYTGVIESVEICSKNYGTFIILDCPSGSGKTLAGVALSLLDSSISQFKLSSGKQMTVRHIIWPHAVNDQGVYKAINARSQGLTGRFLEAARKFDFVRFKTLEDPTDKSDFAWNLLLDVLLPNGQHLIEFKAASRFLLIVIDEVPNDPIDVQLFGVIREVIKSATGACVMTSGTHSKASNMVGLSQNAASLTDAYTDSPKMWALIVTRLPAFVLEFSKEAKNWNSFQDLPKFALIREVINIAISRGGNPRLIVFAIQGGKQMINDAKKVRGEAEVFLRWQDWFSLKVLANKFTRTGFSEARHGLQGQLNLLLEASATSEFSDVLLGHHFAFRAIPNAGDNCFTQKRVEFRECGGFLFIAENKDRVVRSSLMFVPAYEEDDLQGVGCWQTTRFSPPNVDPLLYLMACRKDGYLTAQVKEHSTAVFRACEVVLPLWKSDSAGFVSFQNPNAARSSGCLLEVLLAVSVSNAAAKIPAKAVNSTLVNFIQNLTMELGVANCEGMQVTFDLSSDNDLKSILIPKFIFPGGTNNQQLKSLLGCIKRQRNIDEFDLLLEFEHHRVRFEAKDREKFSTPELCQAVAKLMSRKNNIGVLVVRRCCQYWSGHTKAQNLNKLKEVLSCLKHLGIVYLISSEGEVEFLPITQGQPGRAIVIQVPDSSVREVAI